MERDALCGVGAAIPTLREPTGGVDEDAIARLCRDLARSGCRLVLVCGTTGRGSSCSFAERVLLTRSARAGVPVVCGVPAGVSDREMRELREAGASGLLAAFDPRENVRFVLDTHERGARAGLEVIAYHHPTSAGAIPAAWWGEMARAGVMVKNSEASAETLDGMLGAGLEVFVGSTRMLGEAHRARGVLSGLAAVRFAEVQRASEGSREALAGLVALEDSLTERIAWVESEARAGVAR